MLLKTSLFQAFKLDFNAFSLEAKTKLHEPLKLYPIHQLLIKPLNSSAFNHIFSNLKGMPPLLISPPSGRIGE